MVECCRYIQLAIVAHLLLRSLIVEGGYGGEGSVRNDDKLGLSGSQRLEGGRVSEGDLSGLHDQSQSGVDRVGGLLCGKLLAGAISSRARKNVLDFFGAIVAVSRSR
jgi:hypothetical protein